MYDQSGSELFSRIMPVVTAVAFLSLAVPSGAIASESREDLFVARESAFAERALSHARLEAIQVQMAGITTDMASYQAAVAEARPLCNQTFDNPAAYNQRKIDCERRSQELNAWRDRLLLGPDALLAEAAPLQARAEGANARISDLDAKIRALGPSSEFEREMIEGRGLQQQQLSSLQSDIDRIVVPSPAQRVVHEGVFLGLMNGPEGVEALQSQSSPFMTSGSASCGNKICNYGELVRDGRASLHAFGSHEMMDEIVRGILDNQALGLYTLSTERAQAVVRELNGTRFERLLAHSNGATIAEALIRAGVIEVDEFNVIGGDRSLTNTLALQQLIDSGRVHRVKIWINPGDPIPAISSSRYSRSWMHEAQYWVSALTGQKAGGDAQVEVCYLTGDQGQTLGAEAHDLRAYMSNMRAGGCR